MPRALLLACASLATALACSSSRLAASPPDGPRLAGHDLAHWAAVLEPAPEDRAWLDIPWHPSLHDGLRAAAEAGRPLMLWLMNGHPLGCT